MNPLSVLLVDDNPTFLNIATRFLQNQEDLTVVGVAGGGRETLDKAPDLKPDIIVIDLIMSDLTGLEVTSYLRPVLPQSGIIILTLHDIDGYRQAALAAGADDFVSKAKLSTDLVPAIHRVWQAVRCRQEADRAIDATDDP